MTRGGSVLAARAAEEYRYVALDLRRIGAVVGTLLAVMLVLWVLIDILHIVSF